MKKIVFLGDSITDSERNYDDIESVGTGYVSMIKEQLCYKKYHVINKGIAGNKIADLYGRLQKDCIDLKPDIVCILIGINDVWHFMKEQYYDIEKEMERFQNMYENMVLKIKNIKVDTIILLEPFVLPLIEHHRKWRNDLDQRIHIVRNIANKYQCLFVSIDGEINAYGIHYGYKLYSKDGVHPTQKGHELIAQQFLKLFKTIK